MKTSFQIDFEVFQTEAELRQEDLALLIAARKACDNAYAPYSKFHVGAALLLSNQQIFIGTNQENAAYPSGLCAERSALFGTMSNFPQETILAIAIAARHSTATEFLPVTPCGSCRQVLLEYEFKQKKPYKLIMQGEDQKIYICSSVSHLLPFSFTAKNLE